MILVCVGALSPASVRAATFYVNATGPRGDGSGSSAENAADATPGKYDSFVRSHGVAGSTIIYAPGTYYVYPALPMYSGITHKGAGIDSTIIKMADNAADGPFTPMFLASGNKISNFKFTDVTVDFNATKSIWWKKGTGKCIAFAFSLADHCTIQRIKFINIGAKNSESFPVFFCVNGSANGRMNNNLVDSCIFTQPIIKGNNNGGLTCVQMADMLPGLTTDTTNVVSNNQFLKLKYPEYSDLPYAQGCSCPVAKNNVADGIDSLWFVEPTVTTFSGVTVQVTGNTLTNSGPLALILMHRTGNFAGDLNLEKNTVLMTEHPYALQGPGGPNGVSVCTYEDGNSAVGKITVQENTFTAPHSMGVSPTAVKVNPKAPNLFHMGNLAVINNVLVNFPQDGKEYDVTTDSNCIPHYTNMGNTFQKSVK